MKRTLLIAALLAASAAHAGGNSNDNGPIFGGGSGDSSATAVSGSTSISGANASAVSVSGAQSTSAAIGLGGTANVTVKPVVTPGATNVTVNPSTTINSTAPARIENTPDATVLISSPTAPCRISIGVGGSGPGVGFSIGGSVLDEGCDTREDARMLNNLGMKDAAIKRLCMKPEMAQVLGVACGAKTSASGAPLVIVDANGKVWERPNEYSSWSMKR
jgi:hypothetical protein